MRHQSWELLRAPYGRETFPTHRLHRAADRVRRAQVSKGEYTSISEVVRTALRQMIEREDAKALRGTAKPEAVHERV
ncbi:MULTISPECIES: type II toxin-antitoxin system ParD family antitoxin [unclassified Methylobacterium]|uniref:ribbon-helix-helix domain-containing protein n=1 Tax=unclassified Methylobacterium TaxID=2615210 RepID=UPI0036FE103A